MQIIGARPRWGFLIVKWIFKPAFVDRVLNQPMQLNFELTWLTDLPENFTDIFETDHNRCSEPGCQNDGCESAYWRELLCDECFEYRMRVEQECMSNPHEDDPAYYKDYALK